MIPSFIILFREVLEISLILSIVLVATRGLAGRGRWIWAGLGGGVAGSALIAVFADTISNALEGMGQEIFNAGILFVAVFMIGWTVIWMQKHGRALAFKIREASQAVSTGELPFYTLMVIISLSMWREGAEIVLFMYSIVSTSEESILAIAAGSAGGAIAAATLGFLLYIGLVKIPTRYVFSVTSWLLILVACGMSAQAAGFLTAADMLPVLNPSLWDSGMLLPENSLLGKVLHAMVGYTEEPSGIQLVFYLATLCIILSLQKLLPSEHPQHIAGMKPAH